MKRKQSARIVCIILIGLISSLSVLLARGNSGEPPQKGSGKTISYLAATGWVDSQGSTVDSDLNAAFTKETGIKVDMQVVPADQYTNLLKTKMATNEVPDVFMVWAGVGASQFFPEKNFADLSGEDWVQSYKPYAKSGSSWNGKTVGLMTWSVDGWGILYNPRLFAKHGVKVPATLEELDAASRAFQKAGLVPIYLPGKPAWYWALWLAQFGPRAQEDTPGLYDALNANRAKFADVAVFKTMLSQFKDFYDKGYFGKNPLANSWDSGYGALGEGKAPMLFGVQAYQTEVAKRYPQSGAENWKMFPMPFAGNKYFSHSAGGLMRVAYKNSKNLENVKKFFSFLTRSENLRTFYAGRSELQLNPAFVGVQGKPTEGTKSMLALPKSGMDMEYGVKFWDNTVFGKFIQELMLGSKTPEGVLQEIDKSREKLFQTTGN